LPALASVYSCRKWMDAHPGGREVGMTRQGFTLIELLVVLVVLAILAAFAVNKVNSVKETAYVTTMKADLRNLVLAEEAYFQDSSAYAKKVSCGKKVSSGSAIFCTSAGNTLGTITVVKAKVPNK